MNDLNMEKETAGMESLDDSELCVVCVGGESYDALLKSAILPILKALDVKMDLTTIHKLIHAGGCSLRDEVKKLSGGNSMANLIPCF